MLFVMKIVFENESHTLSHVIFSVKNIAYPRLLLIAYYCFLKSIEKHVSVETHIISHIISSHTYFPQSFLNNIKNQLNKIHIAVDNHRDIYLCRNQVKNRRNEKTTTATYITYYHALHICM